MATTKIKGKTKKVVDSCCAPCASDAPYKPRLYLDLDDKSVDKLKGLTIGEEAQIVVTGKVVSLEQRENIRDYGPDKGKKKKTGSISIEGYAVEIMADEDNEFKQLIEDDDA